MRSSVGAWKVVAVMTILLLVAWFVRRIDGTPPNAPLANEADTSLAASRRGAGRADDPPRAPPVNNGVERRNSTEAAALDAVGAKEAWEDVQRRERCRRFVPPGSTRVGHEPQPDEVEQAVLLDLCAGLVEDARLVASQLERAAELGSTEARLLYASSPGLRLEHMNADFEAWHDWRERAPGYLEEAISRGDGEAAMLFGIASMRHACNVNDGIHANHSNGPMCPRSSLLSAILPRDDVVAYAHLLFAHHLGVGDHVGELEAVMVDLAARMTTEQRAQAELVMQTLRGRVPR